MKIVWRRGRADSGKVTVHWATAGRLQQQEMAKKKRAKKKTDSDCGVCSAREEV